jgi:hypothetical protein
MKRWTALLLACTAAVVLAACASGPDPRILGSTDSQVKLRGIQSRTFDSPDTVKILKTVMATLQDLGFVLDKADSNLGTVSGTKLNDYALRITVTVRPRGETQAVVRANAQLTSRPSGIRSRIRSSSQRWGRRWSWGRLPTAPRYR